MLEGSLSSSICIDFISLIKLFLKVLKDFCLDAVGDGDWSDFEFNKFPNQALCLSSDLAKFCNPKFFFY